MLGLRNRYLLNSDVWTLVFKLQNVHFFAFEILAMFLIPGLALALRLGRLDWWPQHGGALVLYTLVALLVKLPILFHWGLYDLHSRYARVHDLTVVPTAVGLSTAILTVGCVVAYPVLERYGLAMYRTVPLIEGALTFFTLGGVRLGLRALHHQRHQLRSQERRRAASRTGDDTVGNVLVIGGAGYIGSALLPKLLDKGYRVRLLDLFLYGKESIANLIDHPHLEIVEGDFRKVDVVVAAMRDIDTVIHLGAIVGDPACALDEELTIEINLMATRMIAEVAKACQVDRFVFASTCSVYGASDRIMDEDSSLNPVSLYARSKIACEKVLRQMADDLFAPVILRFATIYGLSGRTRFDLVVNLLTAKAAVDGQITVQGGDQWRPFVHVDDAALAVFKTATASLSLVDNQVFNVGSSEQNYTIQQVGEIIQRLVPAAQLINVGTDADQRNYHVDFSKIRRTLGFAPQWTVEQGIQQVIEAIHSGKVQDYRDAKYSNVKILSERQTSYPIQHENDWVQELLETSYASVGQA